jgi:hypothetical protein
MPLTFVVVAEAAELGFPSFFCFVLASFASFLVVVLLLVKLFAFGFPARSFLSLVLLDEVRCLYPIFVLGTQQVHWFLYVFFSV